MKTPKIVLEKGNRIEFLGYQIYNCLNNDGMVLSKMPNTYGYEIHLGNYGEGIQKNVDFCKRDAIFYFMLARPHIFAHTIVCKLRKKNSGTWGEFSRLKDACNKEGIAFPEEITSGDGSNTMIYFKGKPLQK